MSERVHFFWDPECISCLVYQPVPTSHSWYVCWYWIVFNCIHKVFAGANPSVGDFQHSKVHVILAKLELEWIHDDAIVCTLIENLTCLDERFFYIIRPSARVVDASDFLRNAGQNYLDPFIKPIPTCQISLWDNTVPEPPPVCQKGGDVSVPFSDWNQVIGVKGICNNLLLSLGNSAR